MNALVSPVNTVTMTSLELVQFINNQRGEGELVEEMVEEAKYTRSWTAFCTWLSEAERAING